ncbi:Ferrous iron transport protein B [Candidatus Terasakiella magnetica]|uniref:Ferrous iron transport protein B n=1 Tax=Candidatus Terasakiella magnetica TaxID=1867952 RepID=A0A1C3RFS4_9PROT|nr:ferrous iron transport protein B [Candidatus Terasakiella magnetica]SCA56105.1 Ferrous iron transport protein B [Candidatus Terasakiella magnetica]
MNTQTKTLTVALAGNPNCGKTSLLNKLTGSHKSVGNYARVTIDKQGSQIEHKGWTINVIDLPGIYSLSSQSPEEIVGRDYIQDEQPDLIINMLDATNIQRSLFLSTQLIEMGVPRIYDINMIDEANAKGISFDTKAMAEILGSPVIETEARKGFGFELLLNSIVEMAEKGLPKDSMNIKYDSHLEEAIVDTQKILTDLHPGEMNDHQSRWLAIKLMEGDDDLVKRENDHEELIKAVQSKRDELERTHGDTTEVLFATGRYGFINGVVEEAIEIPATAQQNTTASQKMDSIFLHRFFGLPIFIGLIWAMFEATFTLGTYPMDWIDGLMGDFSEVVAAMMSEGLVRDLVVDGILAGVGGTIIFLPNIVILFFFMALFSETGYLARSAFLVDRTMHMFGLHGKAMIPLVMGFGCNVPAVMACRTIESPRARLIAILVNPFMACTARLPVFVLFAGAFFAEIAGTMVFVMYMLSIAVAMVASIILSKFVIKGESESFVMELPPFRMPTFSGILFHMWEKAMGFLKKVGGIILVGSIIIWFLQAFPQNVVYSQDYDANIAQLQAQPESEARNTQITALAREQSLESMEKSYLGQVGVAVTPVFEPLGFNWKDTVAILTGVVAKEVVVATYAVLYGQDAESTEESQSLREAMTGIMTPLVAFTFMVFALLYAPCFSTLAVIKREAGGWKWAGFSVAFSLTIAWSLAFAVTIIGNMII